MAHRDLTDRLRSEGIVTLDAEAWLDVADTFEEVERHNTFLTGDLIIVRQGDVLAAVEQPVRDKRVLRRLAEDEVRGFVQDRLDTYERMWDGCGCKVDYYR